MPSSVHRKLFPIAPYKILRALRQLPKRSLDSVPKNFTRRESEKSCSSLSSIWSTSPPVSLVAELGRAASVASRANVARVQRCSYKNRPTGGIFARTPLALTPGCSSKGCSCDLGNQVQKRMPVTNAYVGPVELELVELRLKLGLDL